MTDDSLKRSRDESIEEDVGVELPPPIAADSVEAEEEDGDLVGPVLPPQLKKRKGHSYASSCSPGPRFSNHWKHRRAFEILEENSYWH